MAQRAGVSFELERLDLEGDELVVAGHWSGVRGLRFVRPTLVADDRRILATLEHKPWAPSLDSTWIAAFPWDRDGVDVDGLALAVSPQVTVQLGAAPPPVGPRREHELEPAPTPAAVTPLRAAGPQRRPRAPEPEPEARPQRASAAVTSVRSLDAERAARLEDQLDAVTRQRDAVLRDRDRALAQFEEAVAAREAAVRTRSRMELAHDEALARREQAEAALAAAQAQRDEANAQRDEVLLAYRGLQCHVRTERAQEDRAQEDRARRDEPGADGAGPEEPIGVRRMPAARTVMAELQRPTKPLGSKLPFSVFDLWVIRVLGTVAAGCFILLLVSILRVFM